MFQWRSCHFSMTGHHRRRVRESLLQGYTQKKKTTLGIQLSLPDQRADLSRTHMKSLTRPSCIKRFQSVESNCWNLLDMRKIQSGEIYLALPLFWPILLAILFRFFCHSGLVKSIYHVMNLVQRKRTFPVSVRCPRFWPFTRRFLHLLKYINYLLPVLSVILALVLMLLVLVLSLIQLARATWGSLNAIVRSVMSSIV